MYVHDLSGAFKVMYMMEAYTYIHTYIHIYIYAYIRCAEGVT